MLNEIITDMKLISKGFLEIEKYRYVGAIATFLIRRYFGLPDDICNGLRFSLNSRNPQN
jgi:hypothetical protein